MSVSYINVCYSADIHFQHAQIRAIDLRERERDRETERQTDRDTKTKKHRRSSNYCHCARSYFSGASAAATIVFISMRRRIAQLMRAQVKAFRPISRH